MSGFRRKANENCVLLGYYVGSIGNFLPTFKDEGIFKDLIGPIFKEALENETDNVSRNVGKELLLLAL